MGSPLTGATPGSALMLLALLPAPEAPAHEPLRARSLCSRALSGASCRPSAMAANVAPQRLECRPDDEVRSSVRRRFGLTRRSRSPRSRHIDRLAGRGEHIL